MIPTYNENLITNAVEKVSKDVVNIASVRMVKDQLLRIFPIEGVGSGVIIDKKDTFSPIIMLWKEQIN